MLPVLFMALTPQPSGALAHLPPEPPDPVVLMRDAFLGVLKQFGVERKVAQDVMGYSTRQHFDDALNMRTFPIYRLSLLPDPIKRSLWESLKRFFGYEADEATNPELERRIAELETAREQEARDREADRARLNELEALVRRLSQPATATPHEERERNEGSPSRFRAVASHVDGGSRGNQGRGATGGHPVQMPGSLPGVGVRGVVVGALLTSAER